MIINLTHPHFIPGFKTHDGKVTSLVKSIERRRKLGTDGDAVNDDSCFNCVRLVTKNRPKENVCSIGRCSENASLRRIIVSVVGDDIVEHYGLVVTQRVLMIRQLGGKSRDRVLWRG